MDKKDMENILEELQTSRKILELINLNILTIKFCVVLSTTLFIFYFVFNVALI